LESTKHPSSFAYRTLNTGESSGEKVIVMGGYGSDGAAATRTNQDSRTLVD